MLTAVAGSSLWARHPSGTCWRKGGLWVPAQLWRHSAGLRLVPVEAVPCPVVVRTVSAGADIRGMVAESRAALETRLLEVAQSNFVNVLIKLPTAQIPFLTTVNEDFICCPSGDLTSVRPLCCSSNHCSSSLCTGTLKSSEASTCLCSDSFQIPPLSWLALEMGMGLKSPVDANESLQSTSCDAGLCGQLAAGVAHSHGCTDAKGSQPLGLPAAGEDSPGRLARTGCGRSVPLLLCAHLLLLFSLQAQTPQHSGQCFPP